MSNDRQEWLEERRKHLGASEAAAVLSLNPHMTPLDVWISKCAPELAEEREDTDFLEFGTDLEPAIEKRYIKATGNKVYRPSPAIVIHPQYPELACTPDGLCDSPEPIVVEYKWESFSDGFGDPGSDQVPAHFLIQGAHQMACTGRARVDFGVLHHAPPIRVYRAHRDLELELELIESLRAWWADHVIKRQEPAIDASESWKNYLGKKYAVNRGAMVKIEPGSTIEDEVRSLIRHVANFKIEEEHVKAAKNYIRGWIGENDGLLCPDGTKVTWRRVKDTVGDVTDWKAIAMTLLARCENEEANNLLDGHTQKGVVVRKGSRRFLITEAKCQKSTK